MSYREIRVRPVVRYIVTDFSCEDDYRNHKSVEFGEFDNVNRANVVAYALAEAEGAANGAPEPCVEPARSLHIGWLRGPGEPKEAIRWELREAEEAPASPEVISTDESRIKYMVDRFLGWRLPENFNPDAGISYTRPNYLPSVDATPSGTNLFDAEQATAMVRYMIKGM